MRRVILAASLPFGLAACAGRPVATFTAGDVTTAQQIAVAAKDQQGAQCWGSLLPVAQAVENGQTIGIATATELYRAAILGAEGPCAPIVLPVVVRLGPLLGIAGTIAALPAAAPVLPAALARAGS
jgi:hypothetical protein